MSKYKVLFQLSGSIACYKACQVISDLKKWNCDVRVIATTSALKFVGEATLEGLSGHPVISDTFTYGEMMGHIDWERWADVIVLCPATANTLNRLASGQGDDLIGSLFLAHEFKKPYLIFPAMNTAMLKHPTVQASIQQLSKWGVNVMASASGSLACGEVGEGRLVEPSFILSQILNALPKSKQKILITAGGTREWLDGVRYIGNFSSGQTAATLAEHFAKAGWDVLFLHGQGSALPTGHITTQIFSDFNDLKQKLQSALRDNNFQVVMHAAAVSDFSISSLIQNGKILKNQNDKKISSSDILEMKLSSNPKLISQIKTMADTQPLVIGFKLTNNSNQAERYQAVQNLFATDQVDWVVQNDLSEIKSDSHICQIFDRNKRIATTNSKVDLAKTLLNLLPKASFEINEGAKDGFMS